MVATSDCAVKSKPISERKASKPLMEKKRRARINKCLDQLKYLLENYYTSNIRKRKLEKADILELTVRHLRSLQKIKSSSVVVSEFSDYQAGFRSCLASVNEYLQMADNSNNGRDSLILSHLSQNLQRCTAGPGAGSTSSPSSTSSTSSTSSPSSTSSTMDSDLNRSVTQEAAAQRLFPSITVGHETTRSVPLLARCFRGSLGPQSPSASHPLLSDSKGKRLSSGSKQVLGAAAPTTTHNTTQDKSSPSASCYIKCHSVKGSSNEVGGISNVWRPW